MSSDKLKPCPRCERTELAIDTEESAPHVTTVECLNHECYFSCTIGHWNALPRTSAELGEIARELRGLCDALYQGYRNGDLEKSRPGSVATIEYVGKQLHAAAAHIESTAAPETQQVEKSCDDCSLRPSEHYDCWRDLCDATKCEHFTRAAPEPQQQCDESKLVRCVHCGVTLAYQGSEADGYEVESCDCKDKEKCDACERQTQQPARPELLREICACLSATGKPPSRAQLERWRDMLGGETVQPGESVAEVVRVLRGWQAKNLEAYKFQREDVKDLIRHRGAELERLADHLSRASVGPAEVWVQPSDAKVRIFATREAHARWYKTNAISGAADENGRDLFEAIRVPVHGAQPKQEGGECEGCAAGPCSDNRKQLECIIRLQQEVKHFSTFAEKETARAETAKAKLAESADDCDDCEHAERYERATREASELRRRLTTTQNDRDRLLERNTELETHAAHRALRVERDELRRKLERAEAAAKGSKAALGEALRKLAIEEEQKHEAMKQAYEFTREIDGLQRELVDINHHAVLVSGTVPNTCPDRQRLVERIQSIGAVDLQPESTEQVRCRCGEAMVDGKCPRDIEPSGDDSSAEYRRHMLAKLRCVHGPILNRAEQDDRGELPGCPDCGERRIDPDGLVSCNCLGALSRESWLRHVAERTVCVKCGELPDLVPGGLLCSTGMTDECAVLGYVPPREWLKRNEVKDNGRTDDMDSVSERAGDAGSGVSDVGVGQTVGSALKRAREAMVAHEPDTWAGHVDRIARALRYISEYLEGEQEQNTDGFLSVERRLGVIEARLDAADKRRERAQSKVKGMRSTTHGRDFEGYVIQATEALCGADESEGE